MAEEDYGLLRVEIDGNWSISEFSKLFEELGMLNLMAGYGIASQDEQQGRVYLESYSVFSGRPMRFAPAWSRSYELEIETEDYFREIALKKFMNDQTFIPELQVRAVQFASPGFVDLLGAGRIVGHISKFILGITDRYLAREARALAREQTKQKILKDKIANAEALVKLSSKIHMDPEAQRHLIRRALEIDEFIEGQMIDQKIAAVREIDLRGDGQRKRPPEVMGIANIICAVRIIMCNRKLAEGDVRKRSNACRSDPSLRARAGTRRGGPRVRSVYPPVFATSSMALTSSLPL
jgi:hypothetical protein